MPLSPEMREIATRVFREECTRRLTAPELWIEVVRVCREATTPEETEAAGLLVGRITALGKMIVGAAVTQSAADEPVDEEEPAEAVGEAA